jgi:hypothetical protein
MSKYQSFWGHYDGSKVILNEEIDLAPGTPLLIFVPTPEQLELYQRDPDTFEKIAQAELEEYLSRNAL